MAKLTLTSPTQKRGEYFEQQACKFLQQQGYHLINHNYTCRYGELDLIMTQQNYLVFVEVRYRANCTFGSAVETINASKIKKLIAAAEFFCLQHSKYQHWDKRFDVVAFDGDTLQLITDAISI